LSKLSIVRVGNHDYGPAGALWLDIPEFETNVTDLLHRPHCDLNDLGCALAQKWLVYQGGVWILL
jgi:hypothetical protein